MGVLQGRGNVDTGGERPDVRQALVRVDDVAELLPERVFVLVTPPAADRSSEVELRRTGRNELVAVAYSTIDALVGACGSGQPWAQLTRARLIEICRALRVVAVVLDAVVDPAPRYPELDSRSEAPLEVLTPAHTLDGYLYIPSRPVREGMHQMQVELQLDRKRRPVMLAFTCPDTLAAGCGPYQPWVKIHVDDVPAAAEEAGAQGVVLNPVLAEQSRHAAPVRDWDERAVIGGDER